MYNGFMENKKNIALRIKYDGTNYHGWQFQENAVSVQATVEDTLSKFFGAPIRVYGCSRTDSGVHALDYILNFKTETRMPIDKLPYALNHHLPPDITVGEAWEAEEKFNARFSTHGKMYIYQIWNSIFKDPFKDRYSWHHPYKLDIAEMKKAAKCFVGTHDFIGFMASGGQQTTTVRTIRICSVEQNVNEPNLITIAVEADAFLYNMVRIIAGTLADVGSGKLSAHQISNIISSKDRQNCGVTAPPQGLFLKKVYL